MSDTLPMTSGPNDSPRWCEHCQEWGSHHTDRHPPGTGQPASYTCPYEECGWTSTQRPTTWPCCPNCLVYEDTRRRVIEGARL